MLQFLQCIAKDECISSNDRKNYSCAQCQRSVATQILHAKFGKYGSDYGEDHRNNGEEYPAFHKDCLRFTKVPKLDGNMSVSRLLFGRYGMLLKKLDGSGDLLIRKADYAVAPFPLTVH